MIELALGVDPQPTRLGLALVTLEDDPRPLWADTFTLRPRSITVGHAVREAIRRASAQAERCAGDVVRVGIERAIVGGPHASLAVCWDSGGVYWLTRDACERVWKGTRLVFVPLRPGQWKVRSLGAGHGNDGKDAVARWARARALAAGWDDVAMNGLAEHDATDALGIAVGAVKESRG